MLKGCMLAPVPATVALAAGMTLEFCAATVGLSTANTATQTKDCIFEISETSTTKDMMSDSDSSTWHANGSRKDTSKLRNQPAANSEATRRRCIIEMTYMIHDTRGLPANGEIKTMG